MAKHGRSLFFSPKQVFDPRTYCMPNLNRSG